jgi:hypothetical protein
MTKVLVVVLIAGIPALAASTSSTPAVTFNKDVLPILQKNCQSCHRPGEVAPMSLLTYEATRPWARAIKTAVLSKKMPPWFAGATPRHFTNERKLTESEINTLVAWVDNGAIEGDAKDRPAPLQFQDGWNIKPDVIVEMPHPFQVPATGDVDNYYIIAKGNFTEDTWLSSAEVRPSNRQVVHHMRVWIRPPGSHWLEGLDYGVPMSLTEAFKKPRVAAARAASGPDQEILAKYNPGLEPQSFAIEDAAKFIPKGSDIVFEAHYITNGKPAQDQSRIGLMLSKAAPARRYATVASLSKSSIVIPPGDSNYEARQQVTLTYDATLAWMQPHMHLRGKDYKLTAYYPSGESEVLLDTRYNFDWQIGYQFDRPVLLPKGTRLLAVSHFDNSPNNPFNPDPNAEVHWGLQSYNEMTLIYFGLIVDRNVVPEKAFSTLAEKTNFE